jgi:hypothetical protein
MLKPSELELKIMSRLLAGHYGSTTQLLRQLPLLRFDARHLTGTGYYLHFDEAPALEAVACPDDEPTVFLQTRLATPCDTVGFTLFIRNGRLSSFEGYTFGDVAWPGEAMEDWLVLNEATTVPRSV